MQNKYITAIKNMAAENRESLEVIATTRILKYILCPNIFKFVICRLTTTICHMKLANKILSSKNFVSVTNKFFNYFSFLPEAPVQVLDRLNRATTSVVNAMFPWYSRVTNEINIRIKNLPIEEDIRMLRQVHLNMLIKTSGKRPFRIILTISNVIRAMLRLCNKNVSDIFYFKFVKRI